MNSKVRVGMIGCGGALGGHMRRLAAMDNVEVVGLADPSKETLARWKEHFDCLSSVPTFSDHKEMLKKVEMDAVEIGSPHCFHYEQICDSLEKGLHVLCEKPMVCTVQHAEDVLARVDGRVFQVSYQRHFQPAFRHMRDAIRRGEIGEIQYVAALQCQNWFESQKGRWRQNMAFSCGGQLNDSGSHLIDIVLWVSGLQADEVFAYSDNFGCEVDINSAVNIKFTSGAQGTFNIVGRFPAGFWEDISFVGRDGALMIRQGKLSQVTKGSQPVEVTPDYAPNDPDANFIGAILGKEEIQAPPECGLRVIEVTELAWKSTASGQPEKLNGANHV